MAKEFDRGMQKDIEPGSPNVHVLNDFSEIAIGGVTYRVRSVFSGSGQLGKLLELTMMEKLERIA